MQTLKIKCFRINDEIKNHCFFILSKGNNSGKPLIQPCPNCFIISADNEIEKEKLYWLLYGLWQGGYFYPYLTGSVIPFIRIDDLKEVIQNALSKVKNKSDEYMKSVHLLQKLEAHQRGIIEQMKLIKQAKKIIMHKTLQ